MANPIFQPVVTPSGYQAQPNANRLAGFSGTRSSMEGLGNLATVAAAGYDIYKDKKLQELQGKVQADLEGIVQQAKLGSPSYQAEVKEDVDVLGDYLVQPDEEVPMLTSKVTEAFEAKSRTLQQAATQGRINSFALKEMLLTEAKQYINQNPAYAREIRNVLSNVLGDSGILERLRLDDSFAEQQQKAIDEQRKAIFQEVKERNIPEKSFTVNGVVDLNLAKVLIDKKREQEGAAEDLKVLNESGETLDKIRQNELVRDGVHFDAAEGWFTKTQSVLIEIANSSTKYPEQINQMREKISEGKMNLRKQFSRFMGDERISKLVTFYDERFDDLFERISKFKSGADAVEFLKNQEDTLVSTQNIGLRNKINVSELNALTNIMASLDPAWLLNNDRKEILIDFADIASGLMKTFPRQYQDPSLPGSTSIAGSALSAVMGDVGQGNVSSIKPMNNMISAFIDGITDPNVQKDATTAYRNMDEYITYLADPKNKDATLSMDESNQAKSLEVVESFADVLHQGLFRLLRTNPNIQVSEINETTGKITILGLSKEDQERFTAPMNRGLGAYAALTGRTPKEAAPSYFSTYFQDFISDSSYRTNNPLSLMDKDKVKPAQFNSPEEGIIAGAKEILDLAIGTGNNPPKNNVALLYKAFRPSTDEALMGMQTEVINSISEIMGVSPRTPLDFSNPRVLSQFIAAVSTVEGNDLIWERVENIIGDVVIQRPGKGAIPVGQGVRLEKQSTLTEEETDMVLTSEEVKKRVWQQAKKIQQSPEFAELSAEDRDAILDVIGSGATDPVYPELYFIGAAKVIKKLYGIQKLFNKPAAPIVKEAGGGKNITPSSQRDLAAKQKARDAEKAKDAAELEKSGVIKSNRNGLKLEPKE